MEGIGRGRFEVGPGHDLTQKGAGLSAVDAGDKDGGQEHPQQGYCQQAGDAGNGVDGAMEED